MGRGVDRRKLASWRRRLARQEASGLTVAAFCRRERVSISLWKYWQRKIEREAPVASGAPPPSPRLKNLRAFQNGIALCPCPAYVAAMAAESSYPNDLAECHALIRARDLLIAQQESQLEEQKAELAAATSGGSRLRRSPATSSFRRTSSDTR